MALDEIEHRVRELMRRHPELSDFVMAMGIAGIGFEYVDDEGNIQTDSLSLNHGDDKKFPEYELSYLADFIAEWDEYLHLTGSPMRIHTADSPIITDW